MYVREVIKLMTMLVSLAVVTDAVTVDLNINDEVCIKDLFVHNVIEGQSLQFKVSDTFHLQDAWCRKSGSEISSKFDSQPVKPGTWIISFNYVRKYMSTIWVCTLLRDRLPEDKTTPYSLNNKQTAIDCTVKIYVLDRHVTVTTNGMTLDAVDVSTKKEGYGYYAEYEYHYQEGEIVDTTCGAKGDGGLRMKYFDAYKPPKCENSAGKIEPHPTDCGKFYECAPSGPVVKPCGDNLLYNPESKRCDWAADVLKLRPECREDNYLFSVKDVCSVNLNFRSLMKLDRDRYLDCIYTQWDLKPYLYRTYFIMEPRLKRPQSFTVLVNGLELVPRPVKKTPNATAEYQYYYTIGEPLALECRVNQEPSSKDNVQVPRISGLRVTNILYEYTSARDEWTIHYQYTGIETLNLICVSTAGVNLQWEYREYTKSEEKVDEQYNIKTINRSFTLGDADNGTAIKCLAKRENVLSSVILILHATSPLVVHNETKNRENTAQNGKGEYTPQNEMTLNGSENSDTSYLVWIIVGSTFGTVFIVVVLCVPMVCRYMKSNIQSRYENPQYENIDEEERPMPIFPSQWNDYAESDSHYTKIDEGHMVDNSYYQGSSNVTNDTQGYYTEINSPVASGSVGTSAEYAVVVKTGRKGRNDEYCHAPAGRRWHMKAGKSDEYVEPAYCSTPPAVDKRVYAN